MKLLVLFAAVAAVSASERASVGALVKEDIGISNAEFAPHYRKQEGLMLCWAACAEMVLSYEGVELPQDAVVTRARGARIDAPGNPWEVFRATNGFFTTTDGRTAVVSGQFIQGPPATTVLYNHLKQDKPIILLYQSGPWTGHAVVLVGMDVAVHQEMGQIEVLAFRVFDPFCYKQVVDWRGTRYEEDESMKRHKYKFGQMRLTDTEEPFPGTITGAIMIDVTYR